jgi:zinc/manganese transport system substrate-binding protein
MRAIPTLAAGLAVSTLLAGCAGAAAPDDSRVRVVASTNVYGSIVELIGGDDVNVTSFISGASQDPHSFEASAQDQLTISRADLLVANGGGYDPFMQQLVDASGSDAHLVLATDVVDLGAEDHDHEANEHLWYDLHAMDDVAATITDALVQLDPSHSETYRSNYDALQADLEALETQAAALAESHEGEGVSVTELVPLYLLEEVGLVNRTPDGFTEAIEEGSDVPPAALHQTLELFTTGAVVLLAYNEQTASPETERVRAAAEAARVPVVEFTETLPDGQDYVSWMTANLDAIRTALPQ